MLEIRNLNVDYGLGDQAVQAVRDVNLTLHRGEVLGLAGESGSGKSTLAYGVTRLLAAARRDQRRRGRSTTRRAGDAVRRAGADRRASCATFRWAETSIVFQGAMNSLNPVHKVSTQLIDVIKAHEPQTVARRPGSPGPGRCSSWSASPRTGWTPTRTSSPAACGSG